MTVMLEREFHNTLEQIKKREWWPVAGLAAVLGRPKKYVYRKIEDGRFHVLNDGGYAKVVSSSVVRYYEEEHLQR